MRVRYITHLSKLDGLTEAERRRLEPVAERYVFRLNSYYESLIKWDDPDDPLRRLVVPLENELNDWGQLDASHEADYTPVRGCQHKYTDTALLLVNEVCGAYCRYCFRKRLFMNDNADAALDHTPGLEYIAEHEEITNVLLTGGDPLIMSTRRLASIISDVAAIPHVSIVRIGSKIPAFNPYRILDDRDEPLRSPEGTHQRSAAGSENPQAGRCDDREPVPHRSRGERQPVYVPVAVP
jgi:KamA family protein